MSEPSLIEVFGENATQTATDLVIKKADFGANFTASANNRAEQLLVALLQKTAGKLNTVNQEADNDIQVTVEPSFSNITEVNGVSYKVFSYTVSMRKPDTDNIIKPDDF